jgi:hypothetical protein
MEPKIITLLEPIEANGETVKQLIIESPRGKDMRKLPVGNITLGMLLDLASACSGIPPSSMDQLCAADAMVVGDAVGDFLGGGRGVNPPPLSPTSSTSLPVKSGE